MNAANTAYSDESLRLLRASLLERSTQLRDRLSRAQRSLHRENLEPSGDRSDKVLRAIVKTASAELSHLDDAMLRLSDGTFALCEHCGKEIEPDRMRVVPYTTACMACAPAG